MGIRDLLNDLQKKLKDLMIKGFVAPETKPLKLDIGNFYTSDEVREQGFDIDEDWMLKLTKTNQGLTGSFITPDKWEILPEGQYKSPEGQILSQAELEAQEAVPQWIESKKIAGEILGTEDIDRILEYADLFPEKFLTQIREAGRTTDTEKLLKALFNVNDQDMEQIFGEEMGVTEQAKAFWKQTAWWEMPTPEQIKQTPWYGKPLAILPVKMQAGLGVAGAYIEKYVERPWQFTVLGQRVIWEQVTGRTTESTMETMNELQKVWEKHGWGSYFSEEFHQVFEGYKTKESMAGQFKRTPWLLPVEIEEWLNPVWFIPVGEVAGVIAKPLSKVPVIGKVAIKTAQGIQAAERGIAYPISKPMELGIKGVAKVGEKVGVKLGEKVAERLSSERLVALATLPTNERLEAELFADNWMKRVLRVAAKAPAVKRGLETTLGWRVLVAREAKDVESIVARGAGIKATFFRMGRNAATPKVFELRAIISDPVKYFGFNKKAVSEKMVARLLPEFKSLPEAGTLEHIFTHPEMYEWQGMKPGLDYVTRLQEINTEVLNMLKAEGIPPKRIIEDWIHRDVLGLEKETGEVVQAVRAADYEKIRRAKTMAEGISWGVIYNRNPEASISTYIERAFKHVGDARFEQYITKFGFGETPLLRAGTSAEGRAILERQLLTQQELADAAKLHGAINRAIRGERLPEQTLEAIKMRFPEQGAKLRRLIKEPGVEKQLKEALVQSQKTIDDLTTKLAKAEKIDLEAIAKARTAIPDSEKIAEAFKVMDYEDRLAFRSTMEAQIDDISRMVDEQLQEIGAIKEFLATDPVALYRGTRGKLSLSLTAVLQHGEMPETLGKKQAQILLMGRELKAGALDKAGRVRWEYIIDELADHFKMSEPDLVKRIEQIAAYKVKSEDLKVLIGHADNRLSDIKRVVKVLTDVDTTPAYIPKASEGMPEAGLQKDMFGYELPYFPKGKATYATMSMEDYAKLVEMRAKAGLPPPDVAVKPAIEGIQEAGTIQKVMWDIPTLPNRKAQLEALRKEAKALVEARKTPFWKAKHEKAFLLEKMRQPGIEEGYIMQPFAGGKIYKRDVIDACNKFFGYEAGLPGLKYTSDVAGILRVTKAALDFSAMAIQGLPSWGLAHAYLLVEPKIGVKLMGEWYKAFGYSVRAFFDPDSIYKWMAKNERTVMQRIVAGGSSIGSDYLRIEAQTGLARAVQKFPPYKRAELSFFTATEMVRDEFWKILSPKAIAQHKEFELARMLDRITGIYDARAAGVPLATRQLEQSFVWFAPNYTRACLTVLGDIFKGGYTGAMARKAIGGMIGAGAAYFSAIQYGIATLEGKSHEEAWDSVMEGFCVYTDPFTGDVEWKPSAQFMSFKVGNYTFGVGGFWYGLIRLAGNIIGCIESVGDKEPIDLIRILKAGSLNMKDNPFINWWYSRSSPLVGTGLELVSGRDFLGYPIETPLEFAKYILTRFEPIWAEQGINPFIPGLARDYEVPEGMARAAVIPAELFGLRTFPESQWVKFYDKASEMLTRIPRDVLAKHFTGEELDKILEVQAKGKLEWQHLPETLKGELLTLYPELEEIYSLAQADSAMRSSGVWEIWSARQEEEKKVYYDRGNGLIERVKSGELDTRELRELWSEAGQNYGVALESLEKDPHYEEIYNYFAKREGKGEKYNWNMDLALSEYQQVMFADYIDDKGDFDWDAKDKAVYNYIERWGQDTYGIIRQMYADEKFRAGLDPALIRLADDKEKLGREYWQLPFKPIYNMDEEDVPAEYFSQWKTYQALQTDAERDAFLEANPDFARDWRAEYRIAHPEDDARLALWGYGGKLQTKEAYDLVVKWGRESGIPLEQMGLGLPPENLIDSYFEYSKIASDTSGNSAEAKLYRLEHPEWDTWGQENWGWQAIEGNINALRISVKWQDKDKEWDGLADSKSSYYVKDTDKRDAKRKNILLLNPEYAADRRRRDAYGIDGFPDTLIEDYATWFMEYAEKPSMYEGTWYEDDWWLMEHQDFYQAMLDTKQWTEEKDFAKIPTRKEISLAREYSGLKDDYTTRLAWRCESKEHDDAVVKAYGLEPAYGTSRCDRSFKKPEAPSGPTEIPKPS